MSGRIAYPFMGPYAASKHALEALSDSLRREFLIYGVDVIVIQPGAIDTPIWDKAAHVRSAFSRPIGAPFSRGIDLAGHAPRRAAGRGGDAAAWSRRWSIRRPRTRYAVPDQPDQVLARARACCPDRWLDRIIGRMLGYRKLRDGLD